MNNRIAQASVIVAIGTVVSRLIGLLRDHLLAKVFGAGEMLDIYYAAFRIPDFVYNLLILGTLTAAFIPVFNQELTRGKEYAQKFASNILNVSLVCMSIVCALLWFAAPLIAPFVVPGFTGEKLTLTITTTRILLLSPIIFTLSSLLGGILQSNHRFTAAAFAPVFYNLGIIGGILVASKFPGTGLNSLVWGVIAGAFLHFLIQLIASVQSGFRWQPVFNIRNKPSLKAFKLFVPKIFGLDSGQVSLLITAIVGSFLLPGSITLFNLGSNISAVPVGIFAVSVAVASFPSLSKSFAEKKEAAFFKVFGQSTTTILTLLIPSALILIMLRTSIVSVLFEAGKFNNSDTVATAAGVLYFAFSIPLQGLVSLFARSFYARGSTIIPVICSIVAMVVNGFLAYLLGPSRGVSGLAIAYSSAIGVNGILLFVTFIIFIKKQLNSEERSLFESMLKKLGLDIGKILIASSFFALSLKILIVVSNNFFQIHSRLDLFLQATVVCIVASMPLGFFLHFFKNPIIHELKKGLKSITKTA